MNKNKRLTNTMKSVNRLQKEIIKNYFNNESDGLEKWFSNPYNETPYPKTFNVLGYEISLTPKTNCLNFIKIKKLPDNESSCKKHETYQLITEKDRDRITEWIKKELREQNRINDFWKIKQRRLENE